MFFERTSPTVVQQVKRGFLAATVCVAGTALTACGAPQSVASSAPPGSNIVSFPSSPDKTLTTVISSSPNEVQAGVSARSLAIDLFNDRQHQATLLALDDDGNLGLQGALYVRSSRYEKRDISTYEGDAVKLLNSVRVVRFRYRNETGAPEHIGFIAQDTPEQLTNPEKDAMNVTNTVSIELRATQQLAAQVNDLRAQVRALKAELAALRRKEPSRGR